MDPNLKENTWIISAAKCFVIVHTFLFISSISKAMINIYDFDVLLVIQSD